MSPRSEEVDYLIVGAGLAGLTLQHFLDSDRVAIVDPNPGAYKVGESFIPESFHHPKLQALAPDIRSLPSYSPKVGTAFVSTESVASFPVPISGQDFSLHVARSDLERLMIERWNVPVLKERVRDIDLATKTVRTDACAYRVDKQILDCSGLGMVVSRALGEVTEVRPAFATWTYFDVLDHDISKFWDFVRDTERQYNRYSIIRRRVLPDTEERGWSPSHTTVLTQLGQGLWSWQIPLYQGRLLSFGVVSRGEKIGADRLFDLARDTHLPSYTIRRRPRDNGSPYNRVHTRNNFANRANVAATMDYILVGDACAFADPVYSVGGGMAINKAIEAAAFLNEGGWTEHKRARWCEDHERLFARSLAAFDLWYEGGFLTDEEATREIYDDFLVGNGFQVGIATHYSEVVEDSTLETFLDPARSGGATPANREDTTARVAGLLGVADGSHLAGWSFAEAICIEGGLQHRWRREGLPELVIHTKFSPDVTRYYRRVGDITLSFLNLWDRPYPLDDRGRALFDALEAAIRRKPNDWSRLNA